MSNGFDINMMEQLASPVRILYILFLCALQMQLTLLIRISYTEKTCHRKYQNVHGD